MKKNKNIFNILIISTLVVYILFILLVLFNNQIANIGILSNFSDTITFKNIDNFSDILIVIGILPEFIIIMFLLAILKKFEKNSKNTPASNIVHIIISFITIYYLGNQLFATSFFTNYVSSNITSYQLINVLLFVLFIFSIIYFITKAISIIRRIKAKSLNRQIRNYEVFLYPFIVAIFIYLVINIFNILILKYIIFKSLSIFSIANLIDLTAIVSLPLNVNLSEVLPPIIIEFFNNFNISLNFSLSDLNINAEFINQVFDNIFLSRIDDIIDRFIVNTINLIFFNGFYYLIVLLFLDIGLIVSERIKKNQKIINLILLVIMFFVSLNLTTTLANIFSIIILVLVFIFSYSLVWDNKDTLKKLYNKFYYKLHS